MTPPQRSRYFGTLWPAACKAQGWDKKDETKRQEVTHEATGSASTSSLTQGQLTLLFNRLKWLADPSNFDKAYADANPDIVLEEDKRARIIWRIEQTTAKAGLKDEWLTQTAAAKCEVNQVKAWRHLPTMELLKLSMTVESRTTELAKARRLKKNTPAQPVQDSCIDDAEGIDMPF
jgi:hypothetical protein